VHGSADSLVPYDQALTLHRALERAGVVNELVTLAGRDHGDFSVAELADVARRMQEFVGRILGSAGVPAT
jgi:dipeptidyl aminopeptidase/acylaminoacyl peptidase